METLLNMNPYILAKEEKRKTLLPYYQQLHKYHYTNCKAYRNIVNALGDSYIADNECNIDDLSKFPFLPVRLFKEYDLLSVPKENITKIVTSSGTTNQISSRIFLDKETATNQQKVLVKIVSDFIGKSRMPMIILDTNNVIRNREEFSTRGSGILGFSIFGTDKIYALDNNMKLDVESLHKFICKHKDETIFLFGFTYIIWKHFYKELVESNIKLDLSNAVMIHGGGWKKLIHESVSKEEFKEKFKEECGISNIYENYGMAEQTGSIFVECECGHLHVSNYSEILIRNPYDFSVCENGESGIMQVMSVLPKSYPGYSLLTEDEGIILGEDDCKCGRKGKYFRIIGRLKSAEIRGCSDTYADKFK